MQIDHGGGQSRMAHQHLDFSDIVSGLQKMGGIAVTKRVGAAAFLNTGFLPGLFVNTAHRGVSQWLALSML